MKKLSAVCGLILLFVGSSFGTVITGSKDVRYTNGNSFTGTIYLGLNVVGAQDSCNSVALVQAPIAIRVMNGSVLGSPVVPGNDCIAPQGSVYLASWRDPSGNERMSNVYSITGTTFDLGAAVPLPLTTSNVAALDLLGIRTLTVTGTGGITNAGNFVNTALGLVTWGSSGTASVDTGISRCGAAIFCFGNGTQGSITGTIKAQTFIIPRSDNLVPATIANDSFGGLNFTTSSGKVWSISGVGNSGFGGPPGASISLFGATSGSTALIAQSVASGTLTLPSVTGTLATINNSQSWTGGTQSNMTLASPAFTGSETGMSIASPTMTSPTVNTGVSQGSGLKHQRFGVSCTTAASIGSACATAYTWTSAFADANYTVSCYGTLASGSPILTYSSKSASQISVGVAAGSAAAAQFAAVDCIAIHD